MASFNRGSNHGLQYLAQKYADRLDKGAKDSQFPDAPNDDGEGGLKACPLAPEAKKALNTSDGPVLLRKNADGTFSPV